MKKNSLTEKINDKTNIVDVRKKNHPQYAELLDKLVNYKSDISQELKSKISVAGSSVFNFASGTKGDKGRNR